MIPPSGPTNARLVLVSEAPGYEEERENSYLAGAAGNELNRMMHEADLMRSEAFTTSVCRVRPPGNKVTEYIAGSKKEITQFHVPFRNKFILPTLKEGIDLVFKELELLQPTVIVALGNVALWALTGAWAIGKWRGSLLEITLASGKVVRVIPTYNPVTVLRQWSDRYIMVQDLRRVKLELEGKGPPKPSWRFILRPSFRTVVDKLTELRDLMDSGAELTLDFDLETRSGHIACAGIAWSQLDALCIPFMCVERKEGYWPAEEEAIIIWLLYQVLKHRNARVRGQNLLYDFQYTYRHWFFIPTLGRDIMLSHHVAFAGLAKALYFQASLYCRHYVYWKDDGKTWDRKVGEDQLWSYNCEDAVRTAECGDTLAPMLAAMGLKEVDEFQHRLFRAVLRTMILGCRIDKQARADMTMEVMNEISIRETGFMDVLGHPLNPSSNPQMQKLFYEDLKLPIQWKRDADGKMRPTLDDKALTKLSAIEPLIRPLIGKIQEYRSLGVFLRTFLRAPLDLDDKMRCSYNICGAETYRFASSENAFNSGTNLQNIPKGTLSPLILWVKSLGRPVPYAEAEAKFGSKLKKLLAEAVEAELLGYDYTTKEIYFILALPNIRKIFVPDHGFEFFDMDLDRADLQVVVWEADDLEMKQILREGVDMHMENAKVLGISRELAKSWVHGCLTAGHEVLTPTGWVPMESYQEGTPILVWSQERSFFEVPSGYNRDLAIDLVTFEGESYSAEMTYDHRVPYLDKEVLRVARACDIPSSARIPIVGNYVGGSASVTPLQAKLLAAYQADGTLDNRGRLRFHFKRQRKIIRLRQLLADNHLEYTNSDGSTTFQVVNDTFSHWGKSAGPYLLDWPVEALDAYLAELVHWDGSSTGTVFCHVTSTDSVHAKWLQTIAAIRGYGSRFNLARPADETRQDLWRVSLNNRECARVSSMQVTRRLVAPTPVFCPQTSTGFFFIRRHNKVMVTGNTNYGGGANTMAKTCGITVHQADQMRKRWFAAHPGIERWHRRTEGYLHSRRFVENRFGYRRYYFDRIEGLLPEALAWVPQSTVACVINRAYVNIHEQEPIIQILLQVHDSLAGQYPIHLRDHCLRRMRELARVVVPYEDPLVIPVGIKTSTVSWGDCG